MKFILLIIATLVVKHSFSQKIANVEIRAIPLSTETSYDVPCENFNRSFDKLITVQKIKDKKLLSEIQGLFSKFKIQKENSIDTRGQIIICYQNKKTRKICFDRFGFFFEKGHYYSNKTLFSFIKNKQLVTD